MQLRNSILQFYMGVFLFFDERGKIQYPAASDLECESLHFHVQQALVISKGGLDMEHEVTDLQLLLNDAGTVREPG